jgi:hypothetical protein
MPNSRRAGWSPSAPGDAAAGGAACRRKRTSRSPKASARGASPRTSAGDQAKPGRQPVRLIFPQPSPRYGCRGRRSMRSWESVRRQVVKSHGRVEHPKEELTTKRFNLRFIISRALPVPSVPASPHSPEEVVPPDVAWEPSAGRNGPAGEPDRAALLTPLARAQITSRRRAGVSSRVSARMRRPRRSRSWPAAALSETRTA